MIFGDWKKLFLFFGYAFQVRYLKDLVGFWARFMFVFEVLLVLARFMLYK